MRVRKLFDHGLEKPETSRDKPAFGTTDSGRAHFGRVGAPYFGRLADLAKDQRGVAMIEYALICALIALALVAGVTQLGGGVSNGWGNVDNEVGTAMGPFDTGG